MLNSVQLGGFFGISILIHCIAVPVASILFIWTVLWLPKMYAVLAGPLVLFMFWNSIMACLLCKKELRAEILAHQAVTSTILGWNLGILVPTVVWTLMSLSLH